METNGGTCHTVGLWIGIENSQMDQDNCNGKTLRKLVSFGNESRRQDTIQRHNTTGSGRPSSSTTEITTARIGEMIQIDQWVALREISSELELSYGSVQYIVSDVLRYS
ncbi:hypothetical protein TNCV_885191 [Trichonephila clavipes]|nr:hypothetical protein TNCV_885191 [Trichonephila clavipes]